MRSPELADRDDALVAHEGAKDALFAIDAPSVRALHSDEVLALALVAREQDEFQASRRRALDALGVAPRRR